MIYYYLLDFAADDNLIHVVYSHHETYTLYYSYSEDNGKTWTRNIKLYNSTQYITYPAVAVESESVFILWNDRKDHHTRIYYKYSTDGGNTWDRDMLLSNNTKYSAYPVITCDENAFHIVWIDDRDENWEIYYKRYLIPTPPIEAAVDIDPDTLNLKSKGRWITIYIELPYGCDVNDINTSSILLEGAIPAEHHPSEVGDYDNDGISDLMVKIDRSEVENILNVGESITLSVKGNLLDGTVFEGEDTIRVINPP